MNLLILAIKQRLFLLFDLTTWNVVLSLSWNLADFTINLKNDILKPRIYSHAWPCSCRAKGFLTLMPWSGFENPSVDQQGTFIQDALHSELPRLLQLLAFYNVPEKRHLLDEATVWVCVSAVRLKVVVPKIGSKIKFPTDQESSLNFCHNKKQKTNKQKNKQTQEKKFFLRNFRKKIEQRTFFATKKIFLKKLRYQSNEIYSEL